MSLPTLSLISLDVLPLVSPGAPGAFRISVPEDPLDF